jgi:hypothetical protein
MVITRNNHQLLRDKANQMYRSTNDNESRVITSSP